MPEVEKRQIHSDDSDSEEEEEEETVPTIDVDPTKLTPLSIEVISKQVRIARFFSS
jgi:translation initiation factor 2 subunit 3